MHPMATSPLEFLTTRELMRILKIKHKQTIYSFIKEGMPALWVGGSRRFIKAEIADFIKKHASRKCLKSR